MAINLNYLQILAISAIEDPDWDAVYRHICRQYSKLFFTPLHIVEELEEEYVLKHFFENQFHESYLDTSEEGKQRYQDIRKRILNPEEVETEEKEDDDWINEMAEKFAKEQQAEDAKKAQKEQQNPNISDIEKEIDIDIKGEEDLPPNF